MEFSSNMKEFINNNRYNKDRIIDVHMFSSHTGLMDENLKDWSVSNISPTLIMIDLIFKDPLEVSCGFDQDELIIDVNLSDFPDAKSRRLPR